ncbi:interleukin 15, like isoform X2 [Platichthys flesus]|uniref:interleukin 15, like isoform X2 n=1 Tax=Platichthys flesus TaxID=8260 RepID=UPI002DBFED2C|nr:interleukin 15, like isoform X2 [Platichthys flesus]
MCFDLTHSDRKKAFLSKLPSVLQAADLEAAALLEGPSAVTGGPALGILCFVSFLSLKTQAAHRRCTKDIVTRVQTLINQAPDVLWDIRLYTPTPEDSQKCPSSTLKCYAEEIKVLCVELKSVGVQTEKLQLNAKLEKLAMFFNQTEVACRQCEIFTKQNATMFLGNLMSALQMMNQQFCEQSLFPKWIKVYT